LWRGLFIWFPADGAEIRKNFDAPFFVVEFYFADRHPPSADASAK